MARGATIINPLPALMNTGNPFYHPMLPGGLNMAGGIRNVYGQWQEDKRYQTEQAQQEYENVFAEKKLAETTRHNKSYVDYLNKSLTAKGKQLSATAAKLSLRQKTAEYMQGIGAFTKEQAMMYVDGEYSPDWTEREYAANPQVQAFIDSEMGWDEGTFASSGKKIKDKALATVFGIYEEKKKPKSKDDKPLITTASRDAAYERSTGVVMDVMELVKKDFGDPGARKKYMSIYGIDPAMPTHYNTLNLMKKRDPVLINATNQLYIDKANKTKDQFDAMVESKEWQSMNDDQKEAYIFEAAQNADQFGIDMETLIALYAYIEKQELLGGGGKGDRNILERVLNRDL